jgi:hypothetical protein
MLDRNWAYWTTFSADVFWFIFVGREFSISLPSDLQTIPVPFVDSGFDSLLWLYPPSNLAPQPNNLSRIFAATCELFMVARRIMEILFVQFVCPEQCSLIEGDIAIVSQILSPGRASH